MWVKRVKVVGVQQRNFEKNGQTMQFNDLHYIDGFKTGVIGIPTGLAVQAAALSGQDVEISMEIEASNPSWLYRVNVLNVEAVSGASSVVSGGRGADKLASGQ